MEFSFLNEKYIQKLFKLFEKYGEQLYVVGGAVRNSIANKTIEDIDFTTTMHPEKMIQMFKENGLRYDAPGINFGTVRTFYENKKYEITTFRQDKYIISHKSKNISIQSKLKNNTNIKYISRFPEVKFITDLNTDAKRRDFTMNAIYVDANGNVTDPFNGINDIKNGIVRFIGNPLNSIDQDPLRILRYFRFCAENFYENFDEISFTVCIANFDKTFTISKRKFINEYNKIMACPKRFIILNKWKEYGILGQIEEFIKTAKEKIQEEDDKKQK